MSNLDKLSFSTTSKKSESAQPNLVLRKKMAASLAEQIEGAKAELAGQPFMRQRQKWMPVEGGGKEFKTIQSAFRKFWFTDTQGKVLIELRFGNKPLPIGGRPSIMVGELANLPAVLTTLRDAVLAGEIDVDIAAVAESRKRGRKVKNGMPTGNGTGRTAKEIFTRAGAK